MATYIELFGLKDDSDLQDKVAVAIAIKAQAIRDLGAPTQGQRDWANDVAADPVAEVGRVLWIVLAVNKDATVPQISGATDANIQAAVDAAVDFITGT